MDGNRLDTTTMLADWRAPLPAWLWVAASDCAALSPDALPPVPLIAIGDRTAPGVAHADMIVEDATQRAMLGRAIDAAPEAAAALVQCLRAGSRLAGRDALLLESTTLAMLQRSARHLAWQAERSATASSPAGRVVLSRTGSGLDVRLDRATARNAIDRAMRDDLFDAFALADADDDIATVRLSAAGRCFGIGADLGEFGTTADPATAHLIRLRTLPAWPLLDRRWRFEVQVHGACIGSSLELAAFADRLTATRDAWFQLPELAMGIMPGFGGTVSIPGRIGRQRAAQLIVSGRRLSARAALAIGLIDDIVDDPPGDDRRADVVGG